MSAPSVAIFGPRGFIGKQIVAAFLDALQSKQISSLKLLTRDLTFDTYGEARSRRANVCFVNFGDKSDLCNLLEDVDVVISCMGTGSNYKENKKILVECCAEAKVKIYIPSEWGTDHRYVNYSHPLFTSKQEHYAYAESLGLRSIAIYTGLIIESSFCAFFGFDTKNSTWNIVGTGDEPLAMTSQKDLGPLTLRTILLAYSTPELCPSHLPVYSDNRSINQYKECFEQKSGKKLRTKYTLLLTAQRDYEKNKSSIPPGRLGPLVNLMIADGSFRHLPDARELINPGQRYFKWTTVNDYAEGVKGLPWKDGAPF